MAATVLERFLADETQTMRLGEDLALALRPGDVLALKGDLGAGKSTLARALIRSLADDPDLEVPSPTFTLVQSYEARIPVHHFYLYRLSSAAEMDELGLDELLAQGAALVVFGGRTALLTSLLFGLVYGAGALLGLLRRNRISLIAAAIGCLMIAAVPVAIGGLAELGFFNDVIGRFVSDGGSANARKEMFDLLAMFSLGDLVIGPDTQLVDTLRRINGLEWGIENPFIRMTLYQGAIVTALVTLAFGLFMYELGRGRRGVWLPMLVWVILLNGSESIATKTTLVAKFIMVVLCLYPLGSRAGRVTRASSAPARRPWPGRAAG